ncbi:MAG: hypothetical protein KKG14_08035 [Alphaproteobacteria bacterium]|nr:hypothetical protein [Alphaproteobacteria bacterium]MBU2270370.1 hypothetical protein [Alphaproteobacteria bacterium]MBU2418638.1 hypothetical protein [Alphaproteobacteria bacterium]
MGFVTVLAGALALLSQDEPVDLTLLLPEKAVIETRIESSERQGEGPWSRSSSTYRIEVRPEGDLGYRTVWRDVDDPTGEEAIVFTDEALVPMRIENLDQVLDSLGRTLAAEGGSAKDDGAVLDFFRGLPPETLTGLLFKDAIKIAYGQGTFLVPGERNDYRQPGGSFGDSGPLMMNASFLLESVKNDRAVVVWTTELDPVDGRKALPGLMRDMLGIIGEDPESMDKLASLVAEARLVMRTECRYEIAVPTGLAEHVECNGLQDLAMVGETRRKETRMIATQRLVN